MRYRIYTKRLMYEIEIHGKYTVLCGDSGGGKSVLYEMIAAKNSGNRAVHIEVYDNGMWKPASVSFFAVAQNDAWLEFHHEKDGSVFVVDEDAAVFKHRDAASVFKKSRHPSDYHSHDCKKSHHCTTFSCTGGRHHHGSPGICPPHCQT